MVKKDSELPFKPERIIKAIEKAEKNGSKKERQLGVYVLVNSVKLDYSGKVHDESRAGKISAVDGSDLVWTDRHEATIRRPGKPPVGLEILVAATQADTHYSLYLQRGDQDWVMNKERDEGRLYYREEPADWVGKALLALVEAV